jgi:transposase-like protein
VFSATTLQTCIVHLIRNHLDCANWKERKVLAAAIKSISAASLGALPFARATNAIDRSKSIDINKSYR